MQTTDQAQQPGAASWKTLYRIAGTAAFIMVGFIPIQIAVFVIWPPPADVVGWFDLFRMNGLIGLLDLDLLLMVDQVLVALICLGLYVALRMANPSLMTLALVLAVLSVAIYFSSTVAFEMLSLSNRYAAAATESEKAMLVSAGQVMLATWQGSAFNSSYIIAAIVFLITGFVMLKSSVFGKWTARAGIVLGILSLVPPTAGTIGMVFAFASLIPLVAWDLMIGRRFLQLAAG